MPFPHLATKFSSASYAEAVSWQAGRMALSEPDHKVVLMLAWLFGVPVGEVRADLKRVWTAQRQAEQNDRDPTGGRVGKRYRK